MKGRDDVAAQKKKEKNNNNGEGGREDYLGRKQSTLIFKGSGKAQER